MNRVTKTKKVAFLKGISPKVVEQFLNYHKENPNVYKLFTKYTSKLYESGITRYSSKAIFERIRWHIAIATKGDAYKMNNNYTSCYARMLQNEDARFATFFATRKQTMSKVEV